MKAEYGIINEYGIWNSNRELTDELKALGYRAATQQEMEAHK